MRALFTLAIVTAVFFLVTAVFHAARTGDAPAAAWFAAGIGVLALVDGVGVLIQEKVKS